MLKKIIVSIGIASTAAIGSKMSQDAILRRDGWTYDKTQKGWVKKTSEVSTSKTESKLMVSNMVWSLIGLGAGMIGYFCTRK